MADFLVGFGAPSTVALWLVACTIAVGWVARSGRALVTVPTYLVVFWFVLPILLQYPFTFSPANALATGIPAFNSYQDYIDHALLICLAGMASFGLSFAIWSKRARPNWPVLFVARALSAWSHSGLLWGTSLAVIGLFFFLSGAGLLGAEGMRHRAMESPVLRPIYNVAATILPLLIAIVLLVASEKGRAVLWTLAVLLLLPALLTGSRGVAFGGIMSFGLTVLGYHSLRGTLDLRRVARALPLAVVLLLVALYLADLRVGQYDPLLTLASTGYDLFYGNNFSDLRDFAWVLAYWDGDWLGGRTQLAGLMGFVPAILSPFRTSWSWGRVSTDIVGLGTREVDSAHPGLRPGAFGEIYLNFGLIGVVVGGLLLGFLVVRLHAATKNAVETLPPFEAKLMILAAFTVLALLFNFYVTAAFFSVYVIVGVLVGLRVMKSVLRASIA